MFGGSNSSHAEDRHIKDDEGVVERFIPIAVEDLVDVLVASEQMQGQESRTFARVCEMFVAVYHARYHRNLLKLKRAYHLFSPDRDTVVVEAGSDLDREKLLQQVKKELNYILERANFEKLTIDEINAALNQKSPYGVEVEVDLDEFEEIALYYRGQGIRTVERRTWQSAFLRKESIDVPLYRRLFVVLKPKPLEETSAELAVMDANNLYLKIFKNIPHYDLEMLFPNTRVKMTLFDKIKLSITGGGGTIGGLLTAWGKITVAIAKGPFAVLMVIGMFGGVLWRQIYKIIFHRTKYMAELTKNLYFYNINNNMGAIAQIVDMAEGEEFKEAVLAYYFLYIYKDREYTAERLDKEIEDYLADKYKVRIDFEVSDGLRKLDECGLLTQNSEGILEVVGLDEALRILNEVWDNLYNV